MRCGKKDDQEENKGECCAKITRWILFGVLVLGLSMTSVTASSCSFLQLTVNPNATEVPMNLTGVVGVGLLRYDPDGEGCRALPVALRSLGFEQTTARIAIIVALSCGSLALLLTCVELLCCRFCGARIVELSFLGTAAIAQACTFFLFGSGFCTGDPDLSYPCQIQSGAYFSLSAVLIYFMSSILICCTKKPKPLFLDFKLQDKDQQDPCCWKRNKDADKKADPGHDEEQPPTTNSTHAAAAANPEAPHPQEVPPSAVVVAYEDAPSYPPVAQPAYAAGESYHSTYATEKPKNTYYWPEKKDEATYAKLPPYRDVAFVDGDAFFDASS